MPDFAIFSIRNYFPQKPIEIRNRKVWRLAFSLSFSCLAETHIFLARQLHSHISNTRRRGFAIRFNLISSASISPHGNFWVPARSPFISMILFLLFRDKSPEWRNEIPRGGLFCLGFIGIPLRRGRVLRREFLKWFVAGFFFIFILFYSVESRCMVMLWRRFGYLCITGEGVFRFKGSLGSKYGSRMHQSLADWTIVVPIWSIELGRGIHNAQ